MLRRLLPAAALALGLGPAALAQTQKGQSFYSGTFSFSKASRDLADLDGSVRNSRSSDIDLAARAGCFVKDDFALGLGLSQQWQGSNDAGLTVRPFARWYRPLGERFSVFLQGEAFYKVTRGESQFLGDPKFGLNGGLGLVYFANKRLAIEASTNLLSLAVARTSNDIVRGTSGNIGLNLNANTLGLSLAYYVGASTPRRTPSAENALVRGTRFLGGSLDLGGNASSISNQPNRFIGQKLSGFNFNLSPQIGWFLRDNLSVGVGLTAAYGQSKLGNVNISSSASTYEGIQKNWSLGIRPFVRNYAMVGPKVGMFLETSLNVGFNRQGSETLAASGLRTELNSRSFYLQAGLRPGITYFLGRRFAVEATAGFVGFNLSNNRYPTATSQGVRELKNNAFSFSPTWTVGSDVGVGLKYYIR